MKTVKFAELKVGQKFTVHFMGWPKRTVSR